MCSHSPASERATTATTGSVSLTLQTSCGTPGSMKMKSPGPFSTLSVRSVAVLVAHPALEDVEHDLEVDVDVGVGDAARRNRRDVHRELFRRGVPRREAGLVADAVPGARPAAAAEDGDAVVAFDGGLQVDGHEEIGRGVSRVVVVCRERGEVRTSRATGDGSRTARSNGSSSVSPRGRRAQRPTSSRSGRGSRPAPRP